MQPGGMDGDFARGRSPQSCLAWLRLQVTYLVLQAVQQCVWAAQVASLDLIKVVGRCSATHNIMQSIHTAVQQSVQHTPDMALIVSSSAAGGFNLGVVDMADGSPLYQEYGRAQRSPCLSLVFSKAAKNPAWHISHTAHNLHATMWRTTSVKPYGTQLA